MPKSVIELLMENVCRNGTMLLNLTQHGRGDLDPEVVQNLQRYWRLVKSKR